MTAIGGMTIEVRDLTDQEVDAYTARGWVVARGLISPEAAAALLRLARKLLGEQAELPVPLGNRADNTGRHSIGPFKEYSGPSLDEPGFGAWTDNPVMGRNASRLLMAGEEVPTRKFIELLAIKLPEGRAANVGGAGTEATKTHQDCQGHIVRGPEVTAQVSLVRNTPEMGTMRFYEGSHKLGEIFHPDGIEKHRIVKRLELSEPLTLEPGDATFHNFLTLHGAGTNRTEDPRWTLNASYIPAGAPLTPQGATNNMSVARLADLVERGEVTVGRPPDHPLLPIVFDPAVGSRGR